MAKSTTYVDFSRLTGEKWEVLATLYRLLNNANRRIDIARSNRKPERVIQEIIDYRDGIWIEIEKWECWY